MKHNWFVFFLLFITMIPALAAAGETGHYVNGGEGILAASLPPPGFYWRIYTIAYKADTLNDGDGNALPVDLDLTVWAQVHRLVWVTGKKLFGADYVADVVIPFVSTDLTMGAFGLDDSKTGLGDIAVEPFVLSWHFPRCDLSTGVAFYLPTGEYDPDEPASPGKDFSSTMFTLGGTYYFDQEKRWSASILSRYEIHSDGDRRDIQPGDDFHFEWGIGKKINHLWTAGLAGYCQWQVSDDSGRDVRRTVIQGKSVHDRVMAIGPEVDRVIPQWKVLLAFRALWEFNAEDRPEGFLAALTFTKIF